MKKPFLHIVIANLVILVIATLAFGGGFNQLIMSVGVVLLVLAIANIGIGLLTLLLSIGNSRLSKYGASMLLFAAISLLCSFTCCSMQPPRL